ncbi:hypothetical protein ACHQM5_030158 [Ranunculus cassubicifolius]
MASDDANRPLLSGLVSPPRPNITKDLRKRKFRRCRSSPTDLVPLDKNENRSIPRSSSSFGDFKPSFKLVFLVLAIYLAVGCLCFYLVKDQIKGEKTNRLLDALYFCIVTMTTVGYGDLVPDSVATKLLASFFVFSGMALVGLILSQSADYLIEKQEVMMVKALHMHKSVGEFEILKEIQSNKARFKFFLVLILLILLIILGTVFLNTVEKLSLIDSFYCVCSTITTLGYGDKSFSTESGRFFAVIWILTSTICLAQFFLYLAELNTETRQHDLVKWVLSRKMTTADLEAADLDDDNIVSAAEFAIYKLKEMGKITQEDVSLVLEEFDKLDVDMSGTLTNSDIMLAQT